MTHNTSQDWTRLDEQDCVDAPIILRVVSDLSILPPHNFASRCDQPQLTHVHLNDSPLSDDPQRSVGLTIWVLPTDQTRHLIAAMQALPLLSVQHQQ